MKLVSHPIVVNPDQFLQTPNGRVWTPERSRIAWQQSYDALMSILSMPSECGSNWTVVIVCGLQGSGKSTWIAQQRAQRCVVYFDAALPGIRHRVPIIEIANAAKAKVEIIWIKVELPVALARNEHRGDDERVPESSIRSVAEIFEEPTCAEGVDNVEIINAD